MKKLLLIEDDTAMLHFLHLVLDSRANIVFARDSEFAKTLIQQSKPDLILIDYYLKDGPSCKLIEWIRSDNQFDDVAIISMSASFDSTIRNNLIAKGVDLVLDKPLTPDKISTIINQYL